MKTLTVKQPWSHLIARGIKRVENRSWATNYRGPLLIHAAKSRDELTEDDIDFIDGLGLGLKWNVAKLTYGAIVAVVNVVECYSVDDLPDDLANDPFVRGPFVWLLADAKPVKPIPAKGKLGLWEYSGAISLGRAALKTK